MSYVVGVASQENHEENNNERLDLTHRIDPTSTDMLLPHETLLRAAISLKNQVCISYVFASVQVDLVVLCSQVLVIKKKKLEKMT
jgi:hypothetical protein